MEGIEKSFPGVHALSQAHFELQAGEVHALVGENGAGKSTLMKVLAGVYSKDAGRIIYRNKEVEIPNPRAAQLLGISIVHQELNLMGHLTVAQNIFIGREPRTRLPFILDDKKLNEQTRALFDALHMKLDPTTVVSQLTVAKQQMVEIAKALSFNSEVLIMDEPTRGVDVATKVEIYRIISDLAEKGAGILIISSELPEILGMSDRTIVMREGRLVGEFVTAQASEETLLACAAGVAQ